MLFPEIDKGRRVKIPSPARSNLVNVLQKTSCHSQLSNFDSWLERDSVLF